MPKPKSKLPASPSQPVLTPSQLKGLSPLDYLLFVMRDENAPPARRDKAAVCAAQYVHPRAADTRGSMKVAQAAAAKDAGGAASGWDGDLAADDVDWAQ